MCISFYRLCHCRHGIGHFLGVHEGPQRIAASYSEYEEGLADGMFVSDEPGYYQPGSFGIRIENDMEVIYANKSSYDSKQFLRFQTITYVPYEPSLIDTSLLTEAHIDAINEYHREVLQFLEPLLRDDEPALQALRSRAISFSKSDNIPGSTTAIKISPIFFIFTYILIMLLL